MAATRAQQAQVLRNPAVLDQLAGCLLAAASNVINESPSQANHEYRLLFANAIIANPMSAAPFVAPSLMQNPTLAGQAGDAAGPSGTPFADGDVDYVVSSVWDTYSNQFASQISSSAPLRFGQAAGAGT